MEIGIEFRISKGGVEVASVPKLDEGSSSDVSLSVMKGWRSIGLSIQRSSFSGATVVERDLGAGAEVFSSMCNVPLIEGAITLDECNAAITVVVLICFLGFFARERSVKASDGAREDNSVANIRKQILPLVRLVESSDFSGSTTASPPNAFARIWISVTHR